MITSGSRGWVAADVSEDRSWTIDYVPDREKLAAVVLEQLEAGPGFALVTNVPAGNLDPAEAAVQAPELVRFLGCPLPQGPQDAPVLGWLVRDEGSRRFRGDGGFVAGIYTSKSNDQLDIHNDGAMSPYGHEVVYFALLCVGTARSGGESILVSSHLAVHRLQAEFPAQLDRLRRPFAFERRHVAHAGQDPILWAPIIDDSGPRLRVRCNRQRVEMAPSLTGIALTDEEVDALDALDSVLARPDGQFRCRLGQGDLLVADDNLIVHSREAFVDDADAGQRRCLVRVLVGQSADLAWKRSR